MGYGNLSNLITLFSNLSCPIPTQPFLHMMQQVADWAAPFAVVNIPLLLPSNSSILPHQLPPLLLPFICARINSNHNIYGGIYVSRLRYAKSSSLKNGKIGRKKIKSVEKARDIMTKNTCTIFLNKIELLEIIQQLEELKSWKKNNKERGKG